MTEVGDGRRARWERATTWPLLGLALLFAGTYATQLGTTQEGLVEGAGLVRAVVWVVFVLDYLVRVVLSEHRLRWVLLHPLDLLVLVAPLLRPVLLALAVLVRRRASLRGDRNVVGRTMVYLVALSSTLVLFVATAVLLAERDAPGATIRSFPDALWWTVVTVTSVGYGDLYPVTGTGRVAATLGMLVGIGVLGTVTATISAQVMGSLRVDRADRADRADEVPHPVDLTAVLRQLEALREEVARLRADGPGPGADPPEESRPARPR